MKKLVGYLILLFVAFIISAPIVYFQGWVFFFEATGFSIALTALIAIGTFLIE